MHTHGCFTFLIYCVWCVIGLLRKNERLKVFIIFVRQSEWLHNSRWTIVKCCYWELIVRMWLFWALQLYIYLFTVLKHSVCFQVAIWRKGLRHGSSAWSQLSCKLIGEQCAGPQRANVKLRPALLNNPSSVCRLTEARLTGGVIIMKKCSRNTCDRQ